MKLVTLLASFGMLVAAVSSEAPAYGAPSAPIGQGPDPLAGINLAQLLSLVSQAGPAQSVQQSYGAPVQQQQVQQSYGAPVANSVGAAPSFSAPIAAQQVAYFGTQQTASANQGGYSSVGATFNAPISSFQANPSSQYGAPSGSSAFSSSSAVSSQYGAPAVRQQVSNFQRTVTQQYGAPAQQQQASSVSGGYNSGSVSSFSGSARALSSQYGAPSTSVNVARNNGGYSSGASSGIRSNSVSGGYASQSQVQASSSAISGGYSGANGINGGFASGSSTGIALGQQGGYSSGGCNGGLGGGSGCGNGGNNFQAGGNDGGAVQQRVHKHVYIHVAPPEENVAEQRPRRPSAPQVPEKHYKILFIKAPAPPTPEPLDLSDVVTPAPEQKTLVYVLLKKPETTQEIRIPTPAPTKPSKPEVYFIRYKSNEGANNGINGGVNGGVNGGPNGANDLNGAYGAPQVAAPIGQPIGVVNNPGAQYGAPGVSSNNGGY